MFPRCHLCKRGIEPGDRHSKGDHITGGWLTSGNEWDCKNMSVVSSYQCLVCKFDILVRCDKKPKFERHPDGGVVKVPCIHDRELRWVHSSCAGQL